MTRRDVVRRAALATVLWLGGLSGVAGAADTDATGTWTWEAAGAGATRPGDEPVWTLTLLQDGEKLTGMLTFPNRNRHEIKGGKLVDGRLSFHIANQSGTNEFRAYYTGTLEGDTIKGRIEGERNGEKLPLPFPDWKARRAPH